MDTPEKPSPAVNPCAKPFWDAAKEEKLILQKCKECDKHIFYPRMVCPHCFSDEIEWVEASGKGILFSYTVVENNAPSAFVNDVPFVVALVRLDEGVQMLSNVVDCDFDELRCDMPVEVTFERLNDEFTLPKFRPVKT
jgi:hypothetical protein